MLVLNADDPRVAAFAARFSGTVLRYGVPGASDLWIDDYQGRGLLGATFTLAGALGESPRRVVAARPPPGRQPARGRHPRPRGRRRAGDGRGDGRTAAPRPAPRRGLHPRQRGRARRRQLQLVARGGARRCSACSPPPRGAGWRCSARCSSSGRPRPPSTARLGRHAAAAAEVVVAVGGANATELAGAAAGAETHRAATAAEALELLRGLVRPGDVVLVKGSRGVGLDAVVDGLRAEVALMLYWLLYELHAGWGPLNVFRYITFRAALAILTALVIGIAFGPALIRTLRNRQIGQSIREEGPESHQAKAGTPTMGGLLILAAVVVPILLLGRPHRAVGLGRDRDHAGVRRHRVPRRPPQGAARQEPGPARLAEVRAAARSPGSRSPSRSGWWPATRRTPGSWSRRSSRTPASLWASSTSRSSRSCWSASSNAVNLTDGLDGLAIGSVLIAVRHLHRLHLPRRQRQARASTC